MISLPHKKMEIKEIQANQGKIDIVAKVVEKSEIINRIAIGSGGETEYEQFS